MQNAPADEARARARGTARHSTPHRLPQLQCECCSKSFNKRAGRRRRFCSDACRMASARAKEALNGSEVQSTLETLLIALMVQSATRQFRETHTPPALASR